MMNPEIAVLVTVCTWYAASAMILIYGVYRMLTDDEVKQLAHQVALMVRYSEQSNLFLETLKAELQNQPPAVTSKPSPIETAFNRRKDDAK